MDTPTLIGILIFGIIIVSVLFLVYLEHRKSKSCSKKEDIVERQDSGTIIPHAPRLYEDPEEQKIYEKVLKENTLAIDHDFFYSSQLGIYNNRYEGRVSNTCKLKNFVISVDNIHKAVQKYHIKTNINNYIVQIHTKRLLTSVEENTYRAIVKEKNGKIALNTDISDLAQDTPDHHVITVKITCNGIKDILTMIDKDNIDSIVIVDDYNPSVFTKRDKYEAFNYNYRMKIFVACHKYIVHNVKTECNIIIDSAIVQNPKQFLISLAHTIGSNEIGVDYYPFLVC